MRLFVTKKSYGAGVTGLGDQVNEVQKNGKRRIWKEVSKMKGKSVRTN